MILYSIRIDSRFSIHVFGDESLISACLFLSRDVKSTYHIHFRCPCITNSQSQIVSNRTEQAYKGKWRTKIPKQNEK